MEIELKYRVPGEDIAGRIWENELFSDMEEESSREELRLVGRYYDTEDRRLADSGIAYRVRKEGEHYIATVKWKGESEDGLHSREELSIPVADHEADIAVFSESSVGPRLEELAEGRELICIMETEIDRRRFRIDTGTGIFELSVDSGQVKTDCGCEEILEVEVELFSGETEELVKIGEKLQKKYGLDAEDTSKYAKGLHLLCGSRDGEE